MKLELNENEVAQFIYINGVTPYEMCPCGSGKKYKWCCKAESQENKDQNDLKALYHNLKSEIWNRRKWKVQICHWSGCDNNTQNCHSIQNKRFLNQICEVNKKVYHFIPMGDIENEKVELKDENITLASTFNGFCNIHDRELFAIIEGNNTIIYSLEQQYAFVYRNFYYMLCKMEVTQQIIIRTSLRAIPRYYENNFKPKTCEDENIAIESILSLRKNQIMHMELSEIISDIESNYDKVNHVWNIQNSALIFSEVRTLSVNNANFCFQTVREYLSKSEFEKMSTSITINSFKDKRYNYISTIILPNVARGQITTFFAISKKHKTESPLKFIQHVNKCSNKELVDILNNIILDAYEELYLSKSKLYDVLTIEQQDTIKDIFTKKTFGDDTSILLEDILSTPKFNFISLSQ